MPDWTAMTNRAAGDVILEADWDAYQGNLEYLLDPNKQTANYTAGSHYSTTSGTFANVDGTNLSLTVETHGGPVLVCFTGTLSATGGTTNSPGAFDFTVDGTRFASANTLGLLATRSVGAGEYQNVSFAVLVTGLTAGSHTFTLQWLRVSGDRTLQLCSTAATSPVVFSAIEL